MVSDKFTNIINVRPAAGTWTVSNNAYDDASAATAMVNTAQLSLQGENADITINGVSLTQTLLSIQQRLNMLTVNPELEQQWDSLKELGDLYRKTEAELLAKQRMWNTLKK